MFRERLKKLPFLAAVLAMTLCFQSLRAHAQSVVAPGAAAEVLDKTFLQSSPIAKTYMARVLLENHEKWEEAYELLRDTIKNHSDEIPSVVLKKIVRATKQVARYLPETKLRETFNRRHLIRPFLEAQYLLNEALMDWRVALNASSDSETVFVEKLLQSYFFPGFEERGTILYPDANTYSFNIFALTPENVQRARRHMSTDKDPRQNPYGSSSSSPYGYSPIGSLPGGGGSPYIPRPPGVPGANPTPVPPFNPPGGGGTGGGSTSPVSPWPRPPGSTTGRGPVDWDNPAFNMQLYKANGFIDDALASGIDLGDITEEVVRIIKQFKIEDRVTNRYMEQSLLMQAISDPGSILFDPQMQEFLKGIRLSVYLGDMPANTTSEWDVLKDALGAKLVNRDKEGNVRIKMSGLVAETRPGSEQGLEIRLQQIKGSDRMALYAISTVAGPDLLRLRTFMAVATIFRDWDKSVALAKTAAGVISQTQAYAFLAKTSKLVIDFSKIGVRDIGRVMMWVIRIAYYTIESLPGIKAASLVQIRELLRTAALTISRGGVEKFTKFFQWLGPKAQQTFNYIKNLKYMKNGSAANGLLLLTLAAESFIVAVEYKNAKDADQKYEVWEEGGARIGSTLTYFLPVVGLGAAIVDIAHVFGSPFETADAFRFYRHHVEDWAYEHYAGLNKMEFDLDDLQQGLNLPRNNFYIERHSKKVASLDVARQRVVELDQQLQDISARYLVLLYVAHRKIAPGRENTFGRKQEDYMREFAGNLMSYHKTKAELVDLMAHMKDPAPAEPAPTPNPGATGPQVPTPPANGDRDNLIPMPGIIPPPTGSTNSVPTQPSGAAATTNSTPKLPRLLLTPIPAPPSPGVRTNRMNEINLPGKSPAA